MPAHQGGRPRAGLLATVPALMLAAAIAPCPAGAGEAVVTAQVANLVDIVDLDAGKVVAAIPVSGAPAGVALSPDRRTAYVTRPDGPGLAVIDLAARKVSATLPLPGGPLGIAVNPASGAVYVADWYAKRVLVLLPKPEGLVQDGEIAVGQSPSGFAVAPDGRTLLVANRESDTVSVVDIESRREIRTIAVGKHPFGIALDAGAMRAYTANVESNDVSVIDLAKGTEIGRVKSGDRPYVVALAGGRGFVTDQYSGTVTAFDLATLKPLKAIDTGDHPEGIAASADGRTVYATNWGDNTLSVIDVGTLAVTRQIKVDDGPRAFGDFLR